MGVTDYFARIKNWTFDKLWMGKNDDQLNAQHFPNLGEDIRKVVQTQEFENVMNSASPFLLTCLGAWPGYWIYRGFDYHSHRPYVPLPMYIRQTFYQAKLLQIIIIMAGIIHIVKEQNSEPMFSRRN